MTWTKDGRWPTRLFQLLCLLLVLLVGLYFRLGTAAHTEVDHPVRNDARDYVAYAWNLKFHGVYSRDPSGLAGREPANLRPDAERPPGYPLMLVPFVHRRIDASFIETTQYTQAWIAEATLLCSILLAMALLGPWAGLAVGALVALSPHQSVYVPYLLTETLYGLIVVLALGAGVLTLRAKRPRVRWMWAGITGAIFGLSCLVRPTLDQWALVLVVLMLIWPALRSFRREILAMAVGFVLVMSPWWARNAVHLHGLSDSLKMRVTVQQGTYPDFMYQGMPQSYGYPYNFDPEAGKAVTSWKAVFSDLAAKFRRQPWAMLRWYAEGKVAYFFSWSTPDGWHDMFTYSVFKSPWLTAPAFLAATSLIYILYGPLIVCGLLGMLAAFLPRTGKLFGPVIARCMRLLALLQLYVIGVHVAGAPFARYSVPFRPLTFLLAVFLLVWLVRVYRARTQQVSAEPPTAAAA
jgi:hypothetical protein